LEELTRREEVLKVGYQPPPDSDIGEKLNIIQKLLQERKANNTTYTYYVNLTMSKIASSISSINELPKYVQLSFFTIILLLAIHVSGVHTQIVQLLFKKSVQLLKLVYLFFKQKAQSLVNKCFNYYQKRKQSNKKMRTKNKMKKGKCGMGM
jgi:hypothetical protein